MKDVEFLYWFGGEGTNMSSDNTEGVSMYCATRQCAAKCGMSCKFTMKYSGFLF
jgi:hypothetical protein